MPRKTCRNYKNRKNRKLNTRRKKKRGGIPRKVFTIYTLALGDPEWPNMFIFWFQLGILDIALQSIPDTYTDIHIVHYNLEPTDSEFVKHNLTDIEMTYPRVKASTFIYEAFDPDLVVELHPDLKDYIIITFTLSLQRALDSKGRLISDNPKDYQYTLAHSLNKGGQAISTKRYLLNVIPVYYSRFDSEDPKPFYEPFFEVGPDDTVYILPS